jgi:hypothetical protein
MKWIALAALLSPVVFLVVQFLLIIREGRLYGGDHCNHEFYKRWKKIPWWKKKW